MNDHFENNVVDFDRHLLDRELLPSGFEPHRAALRSDDGVANFDPSPQTNDAVIDGKPPLHDPVAARCETTSLFYNELIKRNVLRAGAAYIVVAWLVAQVADVICDGLGAPDWAMKAVLISLGIGLPIVLVISWHVEFTARVQWESSIRAMNVLGHQRGRVMDFTIIGVLTTIIAVMLVTQPNTFCLVGRGASLPAEETAPVSTNLRAGENTVHLSKRDDT